MSVSSHPTVCQRCIQDDTIPGIQFNKDGICNYCDLHEALTLEYPNDDRGERILNQFFLSYKKKNAPNCVVGVSGGRDSIYLLWLSVKKWGLKPLVVHYQDGFGNPIAFENIKKACKELSAPLVIVEADRDETIDIKRALLKASVPEMNLGTDIGLASALYAEALRHGIKLILIGQSFRTEGVKPLSWSYFDGTYLESIHKIFGEKPLKPWSPLNPGFHLGIKELIYYALIHRIKAFTPLYYYAYDRKEAEEIIQRELSWVYPGAHYFDDLYHSLIKYVHRVKFKIDMNINSDAALVRSGQMNRESALKRAHGIYKIEDPAIIKECLDRLQISQEEFEDLLKIPVKSFRSYSTSYSLIRIFKPVIWMFSKFNLIPGVTYKKYFECGS